ncbi:MAG: OmpA family protein [Tannerella sp.]|jgi:outer membrane protein OmpA-like peptidoglycan-associated protein|nr:OmpA family protein [Tannerella sp.]
MKRIRIISVVALCGLLVLSGCGMSNTAKGTVIGAGAGAATGAAVGGIAGKSAKSTAIGAAVGGVVGAGVGLIIGKKMDKQKKELEQVLPEDTQVEVIEEEGQAPALKVTFDSGILFATNSSTVSDASKSALRKFAANLQTNPDTDLKIVGHTDNTGKVDYNQTLSEKRAKSVYDYLLSEGVSSKRMEYEGKGIHEPVADNSTAEGRSKNRRVEILILANDKMLQDAHNEANSGK